MAPRRKVHRRARQAILLGCLLFIGSQALLAWGLRYLAPQISDPEYGGRIATFRRRCANADNPLRIIVLGSSRTLYGLRGEDFERRLSQVTGRPVVVCNLSKPGAGPVTQLLFTRRLLADGIRPDLAFVEILPGLLAGQVPLSEIDESRLPYRNLRADEFELLLNYSRGERTFATWQNLPAWATPIHGFRLELMSALAPHLLRYDHRVNISYDCYGGMANPFQKPEQRHLNAEHENWLHYLTDFQLGDRPCRAVRETIACCREANVPLTLLVTPEGPAFHSWYGPGDWEQIAQFLDTLQADKQMSIINARDWFDDGKFTDSHHMLGPAGKEFSQRLAERSLAPLGEARQVAQRARGDIGTR